MRTALIGSAPSSIRLAPYKDPSWTIWGCSPGAYPVAERVDAWFELHRWEPPVIGRADLQVPWFSPEYCQWLANLKDKLWVAGPTPELPEAKRYPVAEMVERFGPYFFTSSLSWMFAMALCQEGVEEIGLWGVDMSATEEYSQQRPGCHYFITLAKHLGIKVTIPPESDLLMPPMLYGVGEWDPMMVKLTARRKELETRLAGAQNAVNMGTQEMMFLKGALDDLIYMQNTWLQREPPQIAKPALPVNAEGQAIN